MSILGESPCTIDIYNTVKLCIQSISKDQIIVLNKSYLLDYNYIINM